MSGLFFFKKTFKNQGFHRLKSIEIFHINIDIAILCIPLLHVKDSAELF
jgi:hypothetical protein